jgi:glutathione S-transferase
MYEHTEDMQSRETWFKEKETLGLDFPNLPYFVDTDGYVLTESLAIHEYIA